MSSHPQLVSAVLIAAGVALTGCSSPSSDVAPVSETSISTPEAAAPLTWQEELAAALEARPKTGERIEVGDRPVTAGDAKAWLAADRECIFGGAVKFSSRDHSYKFTGSLPGGTEEVREGVRDALKTDEYWETCASDLYALPGGKESFEASRELNLDIINGKMANQTFEVKSSGDIQIIPVNDTTIRVLESGTLITTKADGTVIGETHYVDGGTLQVQADGTLRFASHF